MGSTRLPPYARAAFDLIERGQAVDCWVFAGTDAWKRAQHRIRTHGQGRAIVLPPGEDPARYRWPRLEAVTLVPGDCPGATVRELVRDLLAAGAEVVVEISEKRDPVYHYATEERAREVAA